MDFNYYNDSFLKIVASFLVNQLTSVLMDVDYYNGSFPKVG